MIYKINPTPSDTPDTILTVDSVGYDLSNLDIDS